MKHRQGPVGRLEKKLSFAFTTTCGLFLLSVAGFRAFHCKTELDASYRYSQRRSPRSQGSPLDPLRPPERAHDGAVRQAYVSQEEAGQRCWAELNQCEGRRESTNGRMEELELGNKGV